MEEWKEYRLGDVIEFKTGKLNSNAAISKGKYPFFTCSPEVLSINEYAFDQKAILLAGNNAEGNFNIKYYEGKFNAYQRTYVINPTTENVDIKYLYYCLGLSLKSLKSVSQGTSTKFLTATIINNLPIKLPSIRSQKQIVSILSSLDDKIELNRRINENLEQQAQALFKSWFVDFEPFKDGKFVDSELGMIPEGWRVGYYTELVDIKGGGTPKTNIKEFWNGSIPFFSPKDIGPSCFVLNTEKYITTNGLENCNSNLFPPYSVFITARGTVGKVVMVGSEMAMNQSNYALLGKQNISQFYVYLITLQLVSHLLKKANGAVFNAITTRDFASERIIIPFYSIIKSFSSIVKPIYENILLNEFQIKSLSQLRDTLLPRLMSGELKLSETTI